MAGEQGGEPERIRKWEYLLADEAEATVAYAERVKSAMALQQSAQNVASAPKNDWWLQQQPQPQQHYAPRQPTTEASYAWKPMYIQQQQQRQQLQQQQQLQQHQQHQQHQQQQQFLQQQQLQQLQQQPCYIGGYANGGGMAHHPYGAPQQPQRQQSWIQPQHQQQLQQHHQQALQQQQQQTGYGGGYGHDARVPTRPYDTPQPPPSQQAWPPPQQPQSTGANGDRGAAPSPGEKSPKQTAESSWDMSWRPEDAPQPLAALLLAMHQQTPAHPAMQQQLNAAMDAGGSSCGDPPFVALLRAMHPEQSAAGSSAYDTILTSAHWFQRGGAG